MAGFALQHVACSRILILRGRSSEPAPGTTRVAGVVGAASSPLLVLVQTEWYAVAFIVAEMSPSKPSSCSWSFGGISREVDQRKCVGRIGGSCLLYRAGYLLAERFASKVLVHGFTSPDHA
jgi:hypothetical protein